MEGDVVAIAKYLETGKSSLSLVVGDAKRRRSRSLKSDAFRTSSHCGGNNIMVRKSEGDGQPVYTPGALSTPAFPGLEM